MKYKQLLYGIGASLGMMILIIDGKTALEGARIGVDLCLKTVIPSLFPFFILSISLTSSLMGTSMRILRPLGRLCGIPNGTESILISGLLGGYPVGAQCVSSAYHNGQLSKRDAERMLAFCSNAGPAFLFGMVASMFPRIWFAWLLWGIHILSAIFVAFVIPGRTRERFSNDEKMEISLSAALQSALRVMATVCGWVVLFRVIIAFLKRWILWLLPIEAQVAVTGLLELSNGCCELLSVSDVSLRFLICSGILAFGGICVTMQTVSVTRGLSLHLYFTGKILQTMVSLILSSAIVYQTWIPCLAFLLICLLTSWKMQKKSSIRTVVGV